MMNYDEKDLDRTFAGHSMTAAYETHWMQKGVLRHIYINDVYLVYSYKGSIAYKHGRIAPGVVFEPDVDELKKNKYSWHTKVPNKPYIVEKGKIWVLDKSEIPEAIEDIKDYMLKKLNEQRERELIYRRNVLAAISS